MSVKQRQVKALHEHNVQTMATAILNDIRKLMNDMRPGGQLSNEVIIRGRLENMHDKLAGALQAKTWQQLWETVEWPKFE